MQGNKQRNQQSAKTILDNLWENSSRKRENSQQNCFQAIRTREEGERIVNQGKSLMIRWAGLEETQHKS